MRNGQETVKKEMQLKKMLEVCKRNQRKIKLRKATKSFATWNKILKNKTKTKQLQQQINTHPMSISIQLSEFCFARSETTDTFWSVFTRKPGLCQYTMSKANRTDTIPICLPVSAPAVTSVKVLALACWAYYFFPAAGSGVFNTTEAQLQPS